MLKRNVPCWLIAFSLLWFSSAGQADEVLRLRMFFGLSLPSGGAVSLADWQSFQEQEIAKTFEGFNVVDSVGYYKGKPERSKVITVIVKSEDVPRAKKLASRYAARFKQDSVMIVAVPVTEWSFVGPDQQ